VGKRERVGKREEFDGNLLFSHSSISLDRAYEACTWTGRGIAVEEEASLQPSLSAEERPSPSFPPSRRRYPSLRATSGNVLQLE